jgi:hypothetical protein
MANAAMLGRIFRTTSECRIKWKYECSSSKKLLLHDMYFHRIGGFRFRTYTSTTPRLDEEQTATKATDEQPTFDGRKVSLEYNNLRASYKRQVSKLRKEYMDEYQRHKAQDEAERETERAETTRKRLLRQRAKNERSVQNALRQKELRRQAALAFEDHLRTQQEIRDSKKQLVRRAQQLLIAELEEESKLWLTTPDEVEAAFTDEAEQLLWARPQGVLGVANPSLDSLFWNYEGHTWDMSKTYKTQSQMLLEEFEEDAYLSTNIDPSVWTPERVEEQEALENKAQLRANIRVEGRRSLLRRQKEYLDEENETKPGEPPKPMPVPSLSVLGNIKAQEMEGAELVLKDPTKFFIFDETGNTSSTSMSEESDDIETQSYTGPSLGTPVAIRDLLRTGQPQGRVFPVGVGKLPKPDTRTEKEKKRQERQERLWAAAQAQAKPDANELELIPEEDREIGEPIDYDDNEDWDSDDEEWAKGLDPELDSDVLNVPREFRYREEDIDYVIEKLESKARTMESHVRNTIQTMEQEARARKDRTEGRADGDEDSASEPFFDAATCEKLRGVGADVDKYEKLMSSLSHDQLLSLFGLEAQRRESSSVGDGIDEPSSSSIFESIPGLSEEQITGLTELESFMHILEKSNESTEFSG